MPTRSPDLREVLRLHREGILRDLHVHFPAQVTRYDASKQLVDVKPFITEFFDEDDDSVSQVDVPVLSNLPVVFPGAGGFRITFPIQVGDVVEVLIQDRSIDAWQDQGGPQAPVDLRRHNLSDAVAVPGLHDNKHPWTGAASDHMTLGSDAGQQVHLKSGTVELGNSATQSAVNGTSYRGNEDTMLTALSAALSAVAAAIDTTAHITALGPAAATACSTAVTAIATFKAAAATYLSNVVKVNP